MDRAQTGSARLVVCTRNRHEDVARLLETLPEQTSTPALVVVDSSSGPQTKEIVEAFAASGVWPGVEYVESEPGLTRQRMLGVSHLSADTGIVHFLDDDSVPEPEYFERIEAVFAGRPEVLGVGGHIVDAVAGRSRLVTRAFFLSSRRKGSVTPAGINISPHPVNDTLDVEWLQGAAMSYRMDVFSRMSFDTRMEGYSLGEDVDFSYRVGRAGALVIAADARAQHLKSPENRYERARHARERLEWRHRFVCELRGHGVSRAAFWWSIFGEFLLLVPKVLLYRDRVLWRQHATGLWKGIRTIWSAQRGLPAEPRLGD